jgi:hypothetical protein
MQCQIGNRVLANWTHDSYWYPATVQNIEGERIYIRFDDGDKEWTTFDHLMKIDIEVGDRVQCRWKGGAYYYMFTTMMAIKNGQPLVSFVLRDKF